MCFAPSELARTLPDSLGLLTSEVLGTAITVIVDSRRFLCVANGLSAPLAIDLAMRLTTAGRSSEFISDALGQQVTARQLTRDDTVVIISGSGANDLSLRVAHAATVAGATVMAVTSFAASPLVAFADITLVIASVHDSFRDELEHTSRIARAVFLHSLIPLIAQRLGNAVECVERARREPHGRGTTETVSESLTGDAARGASWRP